MGECQIHSEWSHIRKHCGNLLRWAPSGHWRLREFKTQPSRDPDADFTEGMKKHFLKSANSWSKIRPCAPFPWATRSRSQGLVQEVVNHHIPRQASLDSSSNLIQLISLELELCLDYELQFVVTNTRKIWTKRFPFPSQGNRSHCHYKSFEFQFGIEKRNTFQIKLFQQN